MSVSEITDSTSKSISKESSLCTNSSETADNLSRDLSRFSLSSAGSNVSHEESFRNVGHAEHSLSCMKNYLLAGKLCDVTLIAGINGKRVPAHRLVLSAASEYFSAMFTGNLRESNQSEIVIVDVNGDVLQAIVNYCYTGTIEIREENVETLLATACLMQLHEIVEACSRFLTLQLHPSNCLGIAVFAEHQSCSSLLEKSKDYISQHFLQVIENREFLQLSPEQMIILLSNDDLNITSEENIFHALMSWINFDQSRKSHTGDLLALVKLPLLNPSFLVDQVEPIVMDDQKSQKLLMEAFKWNLLPERRQQFANWRTIPRKATLGKLLVVGGMDKNKGATNIESFDPRTNKWWTICHMSGKRLQFGIAILENKLIVVGGRDGLKTLNIMECLDMHTIMWTQMTPMNTFRHGLGVAVLGGTLYAVGGHDGWSYLNTVERWDPATKSWSYVAPMHSQRCSAGVAVLGEKLYAVGGRDGASCLRTVECYDPHTNKWTMCAPLTLRRGGVGVASANGYLYAMGGQDAPANNPSSSRFDCVERYDPSTNTWTTVASLSSKKDAVAVTLFGTSLIAIGGYDGIQYLNTVEQYDPISNEWTKLPALAVGRAGACAITVSNSIIQGSQWF